MVHHRRPSWWKLALLLLLAVALVGAALVGLRVGAPPELSGESDRPGIGRRTRVTVQAREPGRGLSELRVELLQGGRRTLLAERRYAPQPAWAPWAPRTTEDAFEVEVGREIQPDLTPGEATIRVTAGRAGTWLRSPDPVVRELILPVRLTPPSLAVLSTHNYVAQGGSGVVVYSVGESAARDGVQAGAWWSPGAALPGGAASERFALYAVPYDLADAGAVRLVVEDDVGNRAEQRFVERYFARPMGRERLSLSDAFMQKVVPEILARTPSLQDQGDLLKNYLLVNGELRRRNAETLEELGRRSRPQFLWSAPFLPMPNAKVMSAFADRRTYVYAGRDVDQQDHLGFDLASVRGAPIPASNAGVVALAEYFGIYGNTVVVDHGYGLMTLYAHLSAVDVTVGQAVERGQTLGRTGETGLAGGDHLHFTVLLHGHPVSPVDWWDAKWIRDRVAPKLGAALAFETAPAGAAR
jgi:murein DD-endopeptidase MepM/ murein hydrolase activator NlpD